MYSTHQLLIKFKVFSYLYLSCFSPIHLARSGVARRSARLAYHTRGLGSASPTRPSLPSIGTPNITGYCENNLLVLEPPCVTSYYPCA
jgi:hypothetical protein